MYLPDSSKMEFERAEMHETVLLEVSGLHEVICCAHFYNLLSGWIHEIIRKIIRN